MKVASRILILGLIVLLGLGMLTVSAADVQKVDFKGTVRYVAIEGGFWGIVSEDGKNYQPSNLAAEYRQDGLAVQVSATVANRPTIQMWGTTIEIISIARLEGSK